MLPLKPTFAALLIAATGCKTTNVSAVKDQASNPKTDPCPFESAVLTPLLDSQSGQVLLQPLLDKVAQSSALYLIKLGAAQGTDAKNVCSCLFVAGLDQQSCLTNETLINVTSGSATPILLDTKIVVDLQIATAADPDHSGETISTVTATTKFACVTKLLGISPPVRIARYQSYFDGKKASGNTDAPRYGCTLTGPTVVESAP